MREPLRQEMRQRAARAIDALGESRDALGAYGSCDEKRAERWRDVSEKGVAMPWWVLAFLPPTKFRAAIAFLEGWHREVYGDEATAPSREDIWYLASEAINELDAEGSRALRGDGKIQDHETPKLLPRAFTALRRVRAFIVACGVNPDAEGDE